MKSSVKKAPRGPPVVAMEAEPSAAAALPAANAPAPPEAVVPMPLFPPITAADVAGGKVEWRKARRGSSGGRRLPG